MLSHFFFHLGKIVQRPPNSYLYFYTSNIADVRNQLHSPSLDIRAMVDDVTVAESPVVASVHQVAAATNCDTRSGMISSSDSRTIHLRSAVSSIGVSNYELVQLRSWVRLAVLVSGEYAAGMRLVYVHAHSKSASSVTAARLWLESGGHGRQHHPLPRMLNASSCIINCSQRKFRDNCKNCAKITHYQC